MQKNINRKNIIDIKRVTWVGAIVNVILAIVKFVFGTLGHSKAVVADALHSLSDLGTDFAVLLGVKFWVKPADEEHPYGHGRIETLITALISISLIIVAIGIGYNAISTLRNYRFIQPTWIALVGAFLSMISKEFLYRWTIKVGKKAKSSAVIANAWHHRIDAFSSIPVFLSVIAATINSKWFFWDNIGAFVVSLFVLYTASAILIPVFYEFIERGASEKERNTIIKLAFQIKEIKDVHAVRTRKRGSGWYVDMHIEVNPDITVKEGHEISSRVKYKLLNEGPDILDVIIHIEPYQS